MAQPTPDDAELEALLSYIFEHRSFDFRGYKRASLTRRIQRRMHAVGAEGYRAYIEMLEANPGEFSQLFDSILINVTSFLRDKDAWDVLEEIVVRPLAAASPEHHHVRVWSAGSASGEEAYSLAVLLADALGRTRFRSTVKIYATDVDTDALTRARAGRYAREHVVEAFGEERAGRFFELEGDVATFDLELRRALIFGRHDLVQDPPISKIDLLVCRNTLMYFTSEAQREILGNLHFALNPTGVLFLGKSEALVTRMDIFEPLDARQRIVRKRIERPSTATPVIRNSGRSASQTGSGAEDFGSLGDSDPIPQLVVDERGAVLAANRPARRQFALGATDIGEPLRDGLLTVSHPELRNVIDQVLRDRKAVTISGVDLGGARSSPSFDVIVAPMHGTAGVVLAFVDVTRYRTLGADLVRAQDALETAYEELQSTVEELETTNEEMQSTNEELETTNEELQSTNEELETMNEELQSTNEELETMNEELRVRNTQVAVLNSFLESILSSLNSAVIVLGSEMEIRAWNHQAEDLWGLRSAEVQEQHFMNLDIGFPLESLAAPLRACLSGRSMGAQVTEPAVNRRGKTVECTVTISPLVSDGTLQGAILLMDAVSVSASED